MREELHPKGLEVVTVALDTEGLAAAKHWIERAEPEHPSLVDQQHLMDELFGVVNVPTGIWIDEEGTIVRPPEPAFPKRIGFRLPRGDRGSPPQPRKGRDERESADPVWRSRWRRGPCSERVGLRGR